MHAMTRHCTTQLLPSTSHTSVGFDRGAGHSQRKANKSCATQFSLFEDCLDVKAGKVCCRANARPVSKLAKLSALIKRELERSARILA